MPSLGRRRPRAPAPFAYSSIEDHVPTVVGKYMLEIEVLSWLGTRHNEDKVCHNLPPLDSRDGSWPDLGPRRRASKAEWSEDSATGEAEGGHDELRESRGHTERGRRMRSWVIIRNSRNHTSGQGSATGK